MILDRPNVWPAKWYSSNRGEICEHRPAADFFDRPESPAAKAYLRGDISRMNVLIAALSVAMIWGMTVLCMQLK